MAIFGKIGRESGSASQNRETHYLWGELTGMLKLCIACGKNSKYATVSWGLFNIKMNLTVLYNKVTQLIMNFQNIDIT